MAIHLMNLRYVPADELAEIHDLLAAHDIAVYETTAGTWGLSLPALWLRDDQRLTEARALLDDYAAARQVKARAAYESQKSAGRSRTFLDIARENPLRFVLCLLGVGALLYVSTIPFLDLLR